ncbi:MAG: prephenate dehydrogenase/arogenate dehydrogenase family protein [Anaerolineales bacterium]|nr:prephenate dehydrogenase/arogenate dehydrogenase family protein [Anaerolineales bacterium]
MTIQVTIIGLGQIGASIGLALAAHKDQILRVGADRDAAIAQQAKKAGAVDRVEMTLSRAVQLADIVLLALPLDQVHEAMQRIAGHLKEGALVMDTAPVKEAVLAWAKELLPPGRHYVGLTPVINPQYLALHETGVQAAQADLFRDGMLAIVSPPETPSEAFKKASDLVRLLGAQHFFVDPVEVDSLMAATHILPQLMAAALLNITVDQPGWRDAKMLTGRAYAEVTGPIVQMGEATALVQEALLTNQHLVRALNSLIASLTHLRNDVENQNSASLQQRLEHARDGRVNWWKQRQAGNWAVQELARPSALPHPGEMLGKLFGSKKTKK